MKLEGRGSRKKGLGSKAPEMMGAGHEQMNRFDVEKFVGPNELGKVRDLFQGLVSSGRIFNAANLVCALSLASGQRPEGFKRGTELQTFKGYMGALELAYAAHEVLAFTLIAYPEDRSVFQEQIDHLWRIKTRGKKPPIMVTPEEMVILRIALPEQKENYYLGEVSLVKERKEVLKRLTGKASLSTVADKVVQLLLVDPSFKHRIPGVDEVLQRMEHEFFSFVGKGTDESWKHAAMLLRCMTLLSADQVGIDASGKIFTIRTQPLIPPTPLPVRSLT